MTDSWQFQDGEGLHALDENQQVRRGDGYGVVDPGSGACQVTANNQVLGQSDTLLVAAGDVLVNGTTYSISQQPVGLDAANSTAPRRDVVYVDSNGDIQIAKGSPQSPEPEGQSLTRFEFFRPAPADLSGTTATVLAEVWVPAGASSIGSVDIRDRRLQALGAHSLDTAIADELDGATITPAEVGSASNPARAWLEPLSHGKVHNVKHYGAVGDGSTDDSGAIQDAIDAAAAESGVSVVYYADPDTSYLIDTSITPKSRVYHIGDGRSRIEAGDLGIEAMYQNLNDPEDVRFEGLWFDGRNGWPSVSSYSPALKHIYIQGGKDLTIAYNRFQDSPATSIGCDYVFRDRYLFNEVFDAGTDGETKGSNGIGVGMGTTSFNENQTKVPTWVVGNYIVNTAMHAITFEDIAEGNSDWQIAAYNTCWTCHTGISFENVFDGFSTSNMIRNHEVAGIRMSDLPNSVGQQGPSRVTSLGDHVVNGTAPSTGDFVVGSEAEDCEIMSPRYLHNIVDNGTRTLINGVGTNAGDPSTTGQWTGEGIEGMQLYDTTNDTKYWYVNGNWV